MTAVSDLSYRSLQSELKDLGESARGKRDELEERLVAARRSNGGAAASTSSAPAPPSSSTAQPARASGMVSSLLASAARTPLPAAVGAAAKRRVSSSSGGGGGGVSGGKRKAATATTEAKSGRGSGGRGLAAASLLLLLLLGAAATVLFSATSTHPLAARLSEALSPVSTATSELFYEASARAGPARRRAAEALEALRDRWSERARRAAAAAAARARAGAASAPAVVEADSAATGAAAEITAASAAAAAAAAAAASAPATQQAETPTPTPAPAPPAPSPDAAAPAKSTRPCSRSLSPTLVDFLLPAGPAWDGARAAVAAAFQGTRTAAAAAAAEPGGGDGDEDAASSSPSSTSSAPLHRPPTKATAVLLAAWSDEAREAALGLIEAALPQECVHSSPSPMACYLRFQAYHRDAEGKRTAATAGDLQALLTAFLKACPHGIVTVPAAHELPPSATAVLINALSEGGGFEAADGSGHVPAGGALFIGTAAAPPSLAPTTEDEVALVLGAKRALADGLAARGTEAVAADALRRRWDVVAPVIEDEAEEGGSGKGEEKEERGRE